VLLWKKWLEVILLKSTDCFQDQNAQHFDMTKAVACIKKDYPGLPGDPSTPLLGEKFKSMFRLSKTRFQVIMEDVMAGSSFVGSPITTAPKLPVVSVLCFHSS
jgi:hypothetical protein